MEDYQKKYIKYKQKYLNLKKSMNRYEQNQFSSDFESLSDNISKEIYFLRHGETIWNKLGLGQ